MNQQDIRALLGEGAIADMTALDNKVFAAMDARLASAPIPPPPSPDALKNGPIPIPVVAR